MRGTMRLGATVAALVATTGLAVPAYADDGLGVRSTNRFVLDSKASTVTAQVTVNVVNQTPNLSTGGGGYRYFFYTAVNVPIPAGAEKLVATSGGAKLAVATSATKDPSTRVARITFPTQLLYGQKRAIAFTYVVPGEAPRSKDLTRVGPGYASFQVSGFGGKGQTRVEVVAPKDLAWDSTSQAFTSSVKGNTRTLVATTNNETDGFWAVVSLRDAKVSRSQQVLAGKTTFTVQSWPDDAAWAGFVRTSLTTGLPKLESLVGRPWPQGLLTIREDTSVSVRGYDGWFDSQDKEIVVGERLDSTVLFHELAHAWASSDTLAERWLYEGLAETLAARTVRELGLKDETRQSVRPTSTGHIPLATWTETSNGRAAAVDDYAYPASYQVISQLLSGMDDKTFTAVVSGLVGDESAYDRAGTSTSVPTAWQSALDLIETRGGNTKATALFKQWVIPPDDVGRLTLRASTRATYAALDKADGAWLPPEGLRGAMRSWAFESATPAFPVLQPLAVEAGKVQAAAAAAGLPAPTGVQKAYESAADSEAYHDLATTLPKAADAVTQVAAADRVATADRNPLSSLAATVTGLDSDAARARSALAKGDLDGALSAARATTSEASHGTLAGGGILAAALALLVGLGLLSRRLLARRQATQTARADAAEAAAASAAAGQASDDAGVVDDADVDGSQVPPPGPSGDVETPEETSDGAPGTASETDSSLR